MTPEQDCARCRKDITENPYKFYCNVAGEMTVCKECREILKKECKECNNCIKG